MKTEIAVPMTALEGLRLVQDNGMVDARALHTALNVGRMFAGWFRARCAEYVLEEGRDFFPSSGENFYPNSDRNHGNARDYDLTLDTAKELAMVERSETGRKIRRYFIECEKALQTAARAFPPAALGGDGVLARLQELNNGLLAVVGQHGAAIGEHGAAIRESGLRIVELEASARPGPDWTSVAEFTAEYGYTLGSGKLSYLAKFCLLRSACEQFPVGRRPRVNRHGTERRTFSPSILERVVLPQLDRWERAGKYHRGERGEA